MSALWTRWLSAHLGAVLGSLLSVPFLARILRDRRAPGSTIAWLLSVLLVPYVGVPLYLLLGPRKRTGAKAQLYPAPKGPLANTTGPPVVRMLSGAGIPPPSEGNLFALLPTGEGAFAELLGLIEGASHSIHLATFILHDDATGNEVLERLRARAAAGVEVRLLLDGVYGKGSSRRRLKAVRNAGGRVAYFTPLLHRPFRGSDNLRNHRKIVVVDGESALLGGMNIGIEYMGSTPSPERWADLSAKVQGNSVARFDEVFRSDWEFATGEKLAVRSVPDASPGHSLVQVVPSGPDAIDDSLYEALLAACYSARQRIRVATPYFVPDDALARALSAAARRGVEVVVVVPAKSNHWLADLAGGSYLRQVQSAGARIATFPMMLHAKAVVIDDGLAVVGSANFDTRSLFLNYEIALFCYSAHDVALISRWFETLLPQSGMLAPAGQMRSMGEDIGRLFGPLV